MVFTASLKPSRSARATNGATSTRAIINAVKTNLVMLGAVRDGRAFGNLLLGLWFLRQVQHRHTKRAFQLSQLLQVNWADDVNDREFLRLDAHDCQAGHLVAEREQVHVDVIAVFLAGHTDDLAPAAALEL